MVDVLTALFMTGVHASQSPIAAKMDGDNCSGRPYLRNNVERNRPGMAVSSVSTKSTDCIVHLYRLPEYPHIGDSVTVLQEGWSKDAKP